MNKKQQIEKSKQKQPVLNEWISHNEAKAMLQCGKTKYFELIKFGQIKTISFSNRAFVERASVETYIATHDLKYNMQRKDYITKEAANG